ncbi:MAG: phosphoribosylformylglycinamidine synthase subunit PurQ [Deltaproteobacteria bacterium]|nr:phosphoribosylformylglycinamidine synthase subunit PurQ [Deltaproteobacteria bacterium]
MSSIRALVVAGNGTNCEHETAFACLQAGFDEAASVPIWDLLAGEQRLADYELLCLPGGFLDGDDLGAARACANRYRHGRIAGTGQRLWDELRAFVESGKLVLGICNGFQLLVKLGLLPAVEPAPRQCVTLTFNDSGRFEDRWVELVCDPRSPCVFTRGLERLALPVRHGEGKLVCESEALRSQLDGAQLVPLRYAEPETGEPTERYPQNPNGSPRGAAGLCDPSGRVFGLMPHPEAYLHRTHHPRWTRGDGGQAEEGLGLRVFRNAAAFLSS